MWAWIYDPVLGIGLVSLFFLWFSWEWLGLFRD